MSGENKNAVASTDGDSLAALDALLRIRKSGALESLIASSTTFQAQNSEASFGNRESYASSISSTSSSNLPSHLAARLSSLLPLNAASMLFSNANQHNAAMAASAAQYRLAAATNWGNSILAGNARSMSNSDSPSPASARAGTIRRAPDPRPGSLDLDTSSDSGSGKKVESLNSSPSVRKEKVAEALRSKPQRGRKRDDLNETERLELTRTRNREHAKSTR